jgi:hypothetical protein
MVETSTIGVRRPRDANFTVSDGETDIRIQKVVSKGERLEIHNGDEGIKLDSLLLEGLSWQRDQGELQDMLGGVAGEPVPRTTDGDAEATAELTVSNEYSHTTVRKVQTSAGEALQIETPMRGTAINLGVPILSALATVTDTYAFSKWFKTPFGPEDDPVEGPL